MTESNDIVLPKNRQLSVIITRAYYYCKQNICENIENMKTFQAVF